jgi:DNA repair photolyase
LNDRDWSKKILVNLNIAELISNQITDIKDTEIYIGSKCDPYMQIEQKYHLTRRCLEVLSKHNYHVFITTKSDNQLILRDLDLLESFITPPTILMGLSNINQVGKGKGKGNINIKVANEIKKQGLDVRCFITPILPYVMNTDEMIAELDNSIPIYFDKLRVMTEGNQDKKILKWIDSNYPQYYNEYIKILFENDTAYYQELYAKHCHEPRFVFLTDVWGL